MDSDNDDVDIASALLAPPSSKSKGSKKRQRVDSDEDEEEEDALFASLRSLTRTKNLSEGAAAMKATGKAMNKKLTGGGSFQSMALPAQLLKALLQRGFTTPTPIQRAALPSILDNAESTVIDGKKVVVARDHVCMARTGSGKTLCYILPLLTRLGAHEQKFGARALLLVPTRELAMQVLKVGKDLARAFRGNGGGEALRWAMIVGGEGMEEQFEMMAGNPDVIIATPGRLLHLIVEMSLELKAVQYCVFDEADRLFELGFDQQLHEILHRLPPTRQTLLFSATLPSSLVGFAKAGLNNPKLIRLDVESKISKDLQMAYLSVKDSEKEAALLGILRDVIGVPFMTDAQRAAQRKQSLSEDNDRDRRHKGKKRMPDQEQANTAAHQTVVFVSTKHHVESISLLLTISGYAVSSIYGSMDQVARILSLNNFRAGRTSILVVTDLAARGIDVPGVENVINYGFPNGPRSFIHRVGRTARAGRRGWAYTIMLQHELPHLIDLELFLSRPLKTCPLPDGEEPDYANTLVLGTIPRATLDADIELFRNLCSMHDQLPALIDVAARGQRLYEKGVAKASAESYRRAKSLISKGEGLAAGASDRTKHPIFASLTSSSALNVSSTATATASTKSKVRDDAEAAKKREEMLRLVSGFRPSETVFEIGSRGKSSGAQLMRERRKAMGKAVEARKRNEEIDASRADAETGDAGDDDEPEANDAPVQHFEEADEDEVEAVFGPAKKKKRTLAGSKAFADPQFYMGYEQEGADTERGLSLSNGDSFATEAARVQYDVAATKGDTEGTPAEALVQRASLIRWDRKQKKFIKGDGTGSDNKKLIKSESGQRLPASFRAGVYDDWRKKTRTSVPRVGELEIKGKTVDAGLRKYRHKSGQPSDPSSGSSRNAKHQADGDGAMTNRKGASAYKKVKRSVGKAEKPGHAPGGLKNAAQIRKERVQKAKRVQRSTQPGKKGASSAGSGPRKKR